MIVAASLVVRNEVGRYLAPCVESLLSFCDLVVVLDDASDDGTREWLVDHPDDRVHVVTQGEATFFRHEGRTRQRLLDATLEQRPDWVFAIDADELVDDPTAVRAACEATSSPVLALEIAEVWSVGPDVLRVRTDGGWRPHPIPLLWRPRGGERIMDRALSCRRVPTSVLREPRVEEVDAALLHFGWADPAEREARARRYDRHDGGRFHARSHLASIRWPDRRVGMADRPWPTGAAFDMVRGKLLAEPVPT